MTKVEEKTTKSSKLTEVEIEEYRALRAEILTYISAKQNLIYLSVLVVLALLGLQITTRLYLFSLCTVVAIIVFYIQDFSYKIGIAECGAYIRAKFEDKSNELNWETTLSKLNMKYDKQKGSKKITCIKKYKNHFKSIFDLRLINHFSIFALISLIVGWFPLLEGVMETTLCLEEFAKTEMVNIVTMLVASVISLVFIICIICTSKQDFNRIRKEFYIKMKKSMRKKEKGEYPPTSAKTSNYHK